MSEYDDETLVRDSFAHFRTLATAQAPEPDRDEVGAIARRRRRVRVELAAVAVALALVVPAAVIAVTAHRGGTAVPLQTPTPSVSAPASASPSPSPSVSSSAPLTPISFDELSRAGVDLPAWPAGTPNGCPSGHFRFTGTTTKVSGQLTVTLVDALTDDVDHDGFAETVALLACQNQGAGTEQVVAFDRGDGAIVTLGQVTGSGSGPVRGIAAIRADSGGAVGVQVADIGSVQTPDWRQLAQLQWRTYSWNGHAFTQTAGPRSFPTNPRIADLGVTASDLTLNAGGDGAHHGTLTVTVRNNGPGSPATAQLDLFTGDSMALTPPAGVTCTLTGVPPALENNSCAFAPPAAGRSATLVFEYKTVGSVVFRPGDPLPPGTATVSGPYDPVAGNNKATFQVTTAS